MLIDEIAYRHRYEISWTSRNAATSINVAIKETALILESHWKSGSNVSNK